MGKTRIERILVLAKTYPSPSAQYVETSCVAGITDGGSMRRLYPVPFRLIEGGQQFKKWQWIEVRVEKAARDHRPESHKLYVDTIQLKETIDTTDKWASRREWLEKIPTFESFDAIQAARLNESISLALLRPRQILDLKISKTPNPDWTDDERDKLLQEHMQGNLFSEEEARGQLAQLRKVPFDFYYRYMCDGPEGETECKHKIVDWEAGALYWNCRRSHGDGWEIPFRAKLHDEFVERDLMFLMGNIHRFRNQWLIVSLIYPPKRSLGVEQQGVLF